MGARALVDCFMNDKLGDVGGFEAKLRKLVKDGYIGSKDRDVLGAALETGHAVTHRGHKPSTGQVDQVMDIVENLIQKYTLEDAADSLKSKIPARNKKTKKAP
jgi:hypothetical protein